jgi:hypothetical protein
LRTRAALLPVGIAPTPLAARRLKFNGKGLKKWRREEIEGESEDDRLKKLRRLRLLICRPTKGFKKLVKVTRFAKIGR